MGYGYALKKALLCTLAVLLVGFFIFCILFFRAIPSFKLDVFENDKNMNHLTISDEVLNIQTLYNCGPYTVAAVINVVSGKIVDPEILADEVTWRLLKNTPFPQKTFDFLFYRKSTKEFSFLLFDGWLVLKRTTLLQSIIDLLKKYDIKTKEYSLGIYSDDKKIQWLKNQIDNGHPIVLLVKPYKYQHYFTVLGYDENGFMVYDSAREWPEANLNKTTIDMEGYVGNRFYTNSEIIELWNNGGSKIFSRNWAVVCY
jgi:hypothetical protein